MRFAVIDLGTNSVRFDIHQLSQSGSLKRLHREKLMLRLGQGVFTTGRLDPEAVRRTLGAFAGFRKTCQELRVQKIMAFATSALREAQDSAKLVRLIQARTGIEIRVISGREEARLIAKGVLANEKKLKGWFALVDIGGGSTEINICQDSKVIASASFDLGTARLQQVFLKGSPPRAIEGSPEKAIRLLREHVRQTMSPLIEAEKWPKTPQLVGSSGTAKAVGRLIRRLDANYAVSDLKYTLDELRQLNKTMSSMTTSQLLNLPGMEPKRVDMILAGGLLLEEVFSLLGGKKLVCTEFSLRDGILKEELESLRRQKGKTHLAHHKEDLWKIIRRLGVSEQHVRQVLEIALKLFDKLKRHHGLDDKWRDYLEAAVLFHDSGKSINSSQHDKHSYYIVKHSDLPMLEKWESEFIAQLCLHHKSRRNENFPFQNPKILAAFQKLLSILRIADALSQDTRRPICLETVRVRGGRATLYLSGKSNLELEKLRFEQRKELFDLSFKLSSEVKLLNKNDITSGT